MSLYSSALLLGLAYSMMGLGIFISLRVFRIPDITTDGSFTLGGAVTAVLLSRFYWHPMAVLPVVLLAGATAGICTALIHTRQRIHPLLAGILVMTALYSVNLAVMGRSNIPLTGITTLFSSPDLFGVKSEYVQLPLFAIGFSAVLIYLLKTDFGIALRATGENETMVKASGVNADRMKITGLALANAFTAASGFLVVQFQLFADINMGIGIVISGLASVIIGESLIRVFRGKSLTALIAAVITGAVVFRLILAVALSMEVNPNYLKLLTSVLVLLIAGITGMIREKT